MSKIGWAELKGMPNNLQIISVMFVGKVSDIIKEFSETKCVFSLG